MADDGRQSRPVLREADAPLSASVESESSLVRRIMEPVATAMVEHARAGRAIPWALVAAMLVAVMGAVGWRYVDNPHEECSPLLVQHVLHQATVGAVQAERLDALGLADEAEAIRALTDIDAQPDDVRLCVLVAKKGDNK